MKRILFFLTLLLLTVQFAFAQAPTTGHIYCLGANNIAYGDWVSPYQYPSGTGPYVFDAQGSTYNWSSTKQKTYSCYRFIASSGGFGCTIKQSNGTYIAGTRGAFSYSITYCPIDGLEILLLVISAFLSLAFISPSFKLKLLNYKIKWFGK